jgi:hypothetical protein
VSHRRRSWDLPFGAFSSRKVSRHFRLMNPHTVFSCHCYRHISSGPARQAAVPGLLPSRESLPDRRRIRATIRWMLPWVYSLPGFRGGYLERALARSPLTRFSGASEDVPAAPQSIYRVPPRPAGLRRQATATDPGNPHRVFAPARSRTLKRADIRAMYSPRAASHIATD